jgi:hypothetical protein
LNIEISAKRKTPQELLEHLRKIIKGVETYMPKSFDYLMALDLETDLKKTLANG